MLWLWHSRWRAGTEASEGTAASVPPLSNQPLHALTPWELFHYLFLPCALGDDNDDDAGTNQRRHCSKPVPLPQCDQPPPLTLGQPTMSEK